MRKLAVVLLDVTSFACMSLALLPLQIAYICAGLSARLEQQHG